MSVTQERIWLSNIYDSDPEKIRKHPSIQLLGIEYVPTTVIESPKKNKSTSTTTTTSQPLSPLQTLPPIAMSTRQFDSKIYSKYLTWLSPKSMAQAAPEAIEFFFKVCTASIPNPNELPLILPSHYAYATKHLCKIRSVVLLYFFLFLSLLSFFE
jgi:hypothetical protein